MKIPKCKCDKFFASRGYHFNGCKFYKFMKGMKLNLIKKI